MAQGIALLSAYGDADSDIDDAGLMDGGASIVDYAHDEGQGDEQRGDRDESEATVGAGLMEVIGLDGIASMGLERDGGVQEVCENREGFGFRVLEDEMLLDFWLSPPSTPCADALEAKFANFLRFKEQGRNFNEHLRHSKGYRNPDFLQLVVMHQNIDEIGSCFDREVFDPNGYDKNDYSDALASDQRNEADRKEQERRQSQRTSVDYVRATQIVTSQKVLLAAAAAATNTLRAEAVPTIINTASSVVQTKSEVRSEACSNKKSKWDKAGHH